MAHYKKDTTAVNVDRNQYNLPSEQGERPTKVRIYKFLVFVLSLIVILMTIVLFFLSFKGKDREESTAVTSSQQIASTECQTFECLVLHERDDELNPILESTQQLNDSWNDSDIPFNSSLCLTDECVSTAGQLSSSIDYSVDPCDDFYKFACGNWKMDHPIPHEKYDWSHFNKLTERIRQNIKNDLITQTSDKVIPKSIRKLYDFYHGCVNKTSRKLSGYSALNEKINELGGWPTINDYWDEEQYDWENALIKSIKFGHFPLLKFNVISDLMETDKKMIAIGPLTLDIEHFVRISTDVGKEEIIKISKELYNEQDESIVNYDFLYIKLFLFQLANSLSSTALPSREYLLENFRSLTYTVQYLDNFVPGLNFLKILKSMFSSIEPNTKIFVLDINYLKKMAAILNKASKRTIANYFATTFVMNYGKYTTPEMQAIFEVEQDEVKLMSDLCFIHTEKLVPNLLGRIYVDKYFDNKFKSQMSQIVDLMHQSFSKSLDENNWMDLKTKSEAIRKVNSIKKNIAYPKWTVNDVDLDKYFSQITVSVDDYFSSALSIVIEKQRKNFLSFNNPLNSDLNKIDIWPDEQATSVGAFYYIATNGIYFPAGIAQYPFFIHNRPMSLNLGSIGMVIGHEITHSLDDHGGKFNSEGEYKNWWSSATRKAFNYRSSCFVKQYNQFKYNAYNMTVNGTLTLSENIADNGGIRVAYRAFKMYQKKREDIFKPLPGIMKRFSEDQLFFIAFANTYCSNTSPIAMVITLQKDRHSPEPIRVNATLANFDMFSKAFNCKTGTKMNPKNKCILW